MSTNKPTKKVTTCCGCDIFQVAKILTIFEMLILSLGSIISILAGWIPNLTQIAIVSLASFVYMLYLSVELYGLHIRKNEIIVLGKVVRSLQLITIMIFMTVIPLLGLDGFDRFIQDTFQSTGILAIM